MKYVSFTFDDGRKDNYSYAYPIMKKHNISGTLFCTTGYIDGTWKKPASWYSAGSAISINELKDLESNGWELALHGDRHTTDVDDLKCALEKITNWGVNTRPIGFSMPNSSISAQKLKSVIDAYLGSELLYIRTGRCISTKSLWARILFVLYTYGKMQWAYDKFNNPSLAQISNADKKQVYSIVIRHKDNPDMVLKFLKQIPDDTCAVLMFHSILPEENNHYGTDPWNWSSKKFDTFCKEIRKLSNAGYIEPINLNQLWTEQLQ